MKCVDIDISVGNPCDQLTRNMDLVTIFSSAKGKTFYDACIQAPR